MKVRNPHKVGHRILGFSFPPGEVVDCPDEVAAYAVEKMGFEHVTAPKPIADGAPVTKPAKGAKK